MVLITPEQLTEAAKATIEAAKYCFLITVDESAVPHARLMQPFTPEEDLTVWLGTSLQSRKVREIYHNSRVSLAFYDVKETAYITLSGCATLEKDLQKRKRYWREEWKFFFPAGPTEGDYGLIHFVPVRVELMNFARRLTPEPYGLQPAVMIRANGSWIVTESEV
jgi:general stress protein 26